MLSQDGRAGYKEVHSLSCSALSNFARTHAGVCDCMVCVSCACICDWMWKHLLIFLPPPYCLPSLTASLPLTTCTSLPSLLPSAHCLPPLTASLHSHPSPHCFPPLTASLTSITAPSPHCLSPPHISVLCLTSPPFLCLLLNPFLHPPPLPS